MLATPVASTLGQLIALNWSNAALFQAAAVPVLASALFVVALAGATRVRRSAAAA